MRTSAAKVYSYKKGNPYVIGLVPEKAKLILDKGHTGFHAVILIDLLEATFNTNFLTKNNIVHGS